MKKLIVLTLFAMIGYSLKSQEAIGYKMPPKEIAELINADPTPSVAIDADGYWMLLLHRPDLPSVEVLAQDELRLAGIRINPENNGPSRTGYVKQIEITTTEKDAKRTVLQGLPQDPRIGNISWNPKGGQFAFTLDFEQHIELWVADLKTATATKISQQPVNNTMPGRPYTWLPNGRELFYLAVPERGEKPKASRKPSGPNVQENIGRQAPARTYQDLLSSPHDEALFEYYCKATVRNIKLTDNTDTEWGPSDFYINFDPSPSGDFILVETLQKPFSYLVPYSRFPQKVAVYNRSGEEVKHIVNIPLADNIPIAYGSVQKGQRGHAWRNDAPATLYWVEALDGGDARVDVPFRDQLFFWDAPFKKAPRASMKFELRFSGVTWHSKNMAVANMYWWNSRRIVTGIFDPSAKSPKLAVLYDRNFEDRYSNPGSFVTDKNEWGQYILLTDKSNTYAYLTGPGASPEGNVPFLDRINLKTLETERLWHAAAPYYENISRILDVEKGDLIIRRESKDTPPNYFIINWKEQTSAALTQFKNPYQSLEGVEKQVISYEREDGVTLSGNLYLPKDYKPEDGPLPTLMWAYPNEFKDKSSASQVKGSPYEFIRLFWASPIYWVTQGYAVFDDISMPIVAMKDDEEPNDRFVEQLMANAKAAIDKLEAMGVTDRNRVAIGGHSYGAFMTANLLAHSDLFAAGIARSGAYNRTLTPFGFQSEDRTFWENPQLYLNMSPYAFAHKIKFPILLIHGEADNNSGTFPMQSERMYNAIKGHGGTTRLVMLPHESHSYVSFESINHMLWEQHEWLEKWVKNREQ
ncbi:MAG: prolyl oligopeptidase family serine peptidase [Schleiferiaceae bacterium]|nr:prolyl oligopeptidase family serine peptidase [Schleiferiaceae bacterium]